MTVNLLEHLTVTYAYLCGYALGNVTAGGDGWVHPTTLRDLEDALLQLGMTEQEVLEVRKAALEGGS